MSLHLFYYIIPIILLLKYHNYLRIKNEQLKAEQDLATLRNKLYLLQLTGKIDQEDPSMKYMEQIIMNTRASLNRINIWVIGYWLVLDSLSNRNNKHEEVQRILLQLGKNEHVYAIYLEYIDIAKQFMMLRSLYSLSFCKGFFKFGAFLAQTKLPTFEAKFDNKIVFAETTIIGIV